MSDGDEPQTFDKPGELLALHDASAELFDTLRRWFDVADSVALDLGEVDSAVAELGEPVMIAAMAMRKLQALHLIATPGVLTSTDMVVALINDLNRALLQAPGMYLSLRAAATDWDQELAGLDELAGDVPADADDDDPEIERFRLLHAQLHEAVLAVLESSAGEIRYFV